MYCLQRSMFLIPRKMYYTETLMFWLEYGIYFTREKWFLKNSTRASQSWKYLNFYLTREKKNPYSTSKLFNILYLFFFCAVLLLLHFFFCFYFEIQRGMGVTTPISPLVVCQWCTYHLHNLNHSRFKILAGETWT